MKNARMETVGYADNVVVAGGMVTCDLHITDAETVKDGMPPHLSIVTGDRHG